MKKKYALFIAFSFAALFFQDIVAGPARRNTFWHALPDGTSVPLLLKGDEFGHTFTTLDGLPVILEEGGRVRLRTAEEVSQLQQSRSACMEACWAQQMRSSDVPQQRTDDAIPAYRKNNFPSKGEIRGVVLLVEFANVSFSQDSASIHNLLNARYNADNYTEQVNYRGWSSLRQDTIETNVTIPGSARDYYRSQSLGQFSPRFDVIGPIRLDHDRIYYGGDNRSGRDSNARGMIKDACQKAYDTGLTDFTSYDNDGDGMVDFVYVVYAGNDEAQSGWSECIWAQAWALDSPLKLGKVNVYDYACSAELCYDTNCFVAGIGTFVHEFSHVIGLPDFYNINQTAANPDFAMDYWSVMDYGLYNGEGFVPAAFTSFERYSMGWLPMETLDQPGEFSLEQTDICRKGYRTFVNANDTSSFYIFENIQKNGWNAYAPSYGLQITCVNYDASAWQSNTVNTSRFRHRYHIIPANNDYCYLTANEHLFGKNNHAFGPETEPASITQFGETLYKPLTNIQRAKNAPATFTFMEDANGVALHTADSPIEVYTLDGKRVDGCMGIPATLPQGIYIIKEGNRTRKLKMK